jgi:hypothetical protein
VGRLRSGDDPLGAGEEAPGVETLTPPRPRIESPSTADSARRPQITVVYDGLCSLCTTSVANFAQGPANAALNIEQGQHPDGGILRYKNVGAPGSVIGSGRGVQWSGTLSAAIPPQVMSVSPGSSPAGGYLPLSLFGITPIAGVGDDTITNFNVPTFFYGGESYTQLGVVSNGYLVVGGGTSGDLVFTPQHFPNAARPNNVLAPLWSDLNPTVGGGAIRIGTLTDGSQTWIVVDWQHVKNFGNATTHSFEAWIRIASGSAGTGPGSEDVSWTYGTGADAGNAGTGDSDSGVNWGAENRTGSSGANISPAPADGSQYQVHTTGPTAGGSVSIPYDISAKKAGSYGSVASMTSDQTPGITQVVTGLTVTP